jgi:cell division protein FtsQ
MADRSSGRRWRLVRARRDAVPTSVRRFNARVRQRRWRAVAPWLAGAAALVLLAVAGAALWFTPVCGVRQIRVVGAGLVTADEVRAAAAVPAGTPLPRVDLGAVARRVAGLVPVQRAVVTREWPGGLAVRVTERTAVAAVPGPAGSFHLLDAAGVLFTTVAERPAELPTMRLETAGPADPATKAALSVLRDLPPELRDRLVELAAPAPARIRLVLTGKREVVWGDASDGPTKARAVVSLLASRKDGVIDVSASPVVTVR